jgi:hypothetical protein
MVPPRGSLGPVSPAPQRRVGVGAFRGSIRDKLVTAQSPTEGQAGQPIVYLITDGFQRLLAHLVVEDGLVVVAVVEDDAVLAGFDDVAVHFDLSGILVVIHHDHPPAAVLRAVVAQFHWLIPPGFVGSRSVQFLDGLDFHMRHRPMHLDPHAHGRFRRLPAAGPNLHATPRSFNSWRK